MMKKEWSSLLLYGKLLFCSLIIISCRHKNDNSKIDITILWDKGRASGISIPFNIIDDSSVDSLKKNLQVKLAKHGEQPAIAGDYFVQRGEFIFKPLIPLTRGLHYEVLLNQKTLGEIEIPRDTIVPKLISIFPNQDTVPENLLKIYLIFSSPMVQGHSLQYIKLINEKGDSLPNTFLYLQQELWNEDGTELTVWLDPGRIKRDLIPNKKMGPPLIAGKHYKLFISGNWEDINGTSLSRSYTKNFVAAVRDSISPSPDKWEIRIPEKNTSTTLEISFGEALDHALLKHAIRIVDSGGAILNGTASIKDDQKTYLFTPVKPWSPGSYEILVEGRLEDLAGNNLNRLFDVDLNNTSNSRITKNIFERKWRIN